MGEEGEYGAICFCDGRTRQVDLAKLDFVAARHVRVVACVLICLVEDEVCVFVDQFLHGILYELIERVELLTNEALLVEETGYDCPAILLGDFRKIPTVVVHAIVGVIVRIVLLGKISNTAQFS